MPSIVPERAWTAMISRNESLDQVHDRLAENLVTIAQSLGDRIPTEILQHSAPPRAPHCFSAIIIPQQEQQRLGQFLDVVFLYHKARHTIHHRFRNRA